MNLKLLILKTSKLTNRSKLTFISAIFASQLLLFSNKGFTQIQNGSSFQFLCQSEVTLIGQGGIIKTAQLNSGVGVYGVPNIGQNPYVVSILGTVIFQNISLALDKGVTLKIPNGQCLVIDNSHLYNCTDMWNGIVVEPGGQLIIKNNSIIEDAISAVSIDYNNTSSYNVIGYNGNQKILTIDGSVLNNNYVGVSLSNMKLQQNIPISIIGSLFTFRNIFTHATTSAIGSYKCSSYTQLTNFMKNEPISTFYCLTPEYSFNPNVIVSTSLHQPYQNDKPKAGILVDNVGATCITNINLCSNVPKILSTYTETVYPLIVGLSPTSSLPLSTSANVFDNLCFGILAKQQSNGVEFPRNNYNQINSNESNLRCYDNVFQNMIYQGSMPSSLSYQYGGTGIFLRNYTLDGQGSLILGSSYITSSDDYKYYYGNRFYNCVRSLVCDMYMDVDVRYSTFKSNQSLSSTAAPQFSIASNSQHYGYQGLFIETGQFLKYSILSNKFYNIESPITMNTRPIPGNGLFSCFGSPAMGLGTFVDGEVNINYNTIDKFCSVCTSNPASGSEYTNTAIYLSNLLQTQMTTQPTPPTPYSPISGLQPFNPITISYNFINNSFRGINISNFNNNSTATGGKLFYLYQNTIYLRNAATAFANNTISNADQYGINFDANYPPKIQLACPIPIYIVSNHSQNYIGKNAIFRAGSSNSNIVNQNPNATATPCNALSKEYGIKVNSTPYTTVSCNNVANVARGIQFSGNCNFSIFRNNTLFQNSYFGFVLDNVGIIGQQGSTSSAANNSWQGTTWNNSVGSYNAAVPYMTFCNISSPTPSSRMFVATTSTTDPTYSSGANVNFNALNHYVSGFSLITNSSGFSSNCSTNYPFNFPTVPNPLPDYSNDELSAYRQMLKTDTLLSADTTTNVIDWQGLNEIIVGQAAADSPYPIETDYIAKYDLYHYIRNHADSILGRDPMIDDFYNQSLNSNYRLIDSIMSVLTDSNTTNLQNLISTFSPQNHIEQNYMNLMDWIRKFKSSDFLGIDSSAQSLSSIDSASILTLANSCPYYEGYGVYIARALWCLLNHAGIDFTDDCNAPAGANISNQRKYKPKNQIKLNNVRFSNTKLQIYPNPNTGNFTVVLPNENYQISITDLSGRAVRYNCKNSGTNKQIELTEAASGLYFITLQNNTTHEKYIQKITIQ